MLSAWDERILAIIENRGAVTRSRLGEAVQDSITEKSVQRSLNRLRKAGRVVRYHTGGRVAGEDVYLKPGLAQVLEKYGWDKVLQKLDLQKEAGKRCPVCKEAFRFPDDLLDHLKVHLYEALMKFENEQARAKRASVQ